MASLGERRVFTALCLAVALVLWPAAERADAPGAAGKPPAVAARSARPAPTVPATAGATYRPGGHFTQSSDDGAPEFWGSCGGTVAINARRMTPAALVVVKGAARDFATAATGTWTIVTTSRTAGSGRVVVVVADEVPAGDGAWGIAQYSATPGTWGGRASATISAVTVHLASAMMSPANAALLRAVTLHELGHVAGADHSSDLRDIMAPVVDEVCPSYTAAEAAGIRRAGSRACR